MNSEWISSGNGFIPAAIVEASFSFYADDRPIGPHPAGTTTLQFEGTNHTSTSE